MGGRKRKIAFNNFAAIDWKVRSMRSIFTIRINYNIFHSFCHDCKHNKKVKAQAIYVFFQIELD